MNFKGSQTEKNLLHAFAGECQARNTYQTFAAIARKEGYIRIADFFEEAANHELSHAKNFSKFFEDGIAEFNSIISIPKIGTTIENLVFAIQNELFEAENLYMQYAETAKIEGFGKIAAKFKSIAKAEVFHHNQFKKYASQITNNTYFHNDEIIEWYCIKCGYVHSGKSAPEKCPACNHPQSYFTPVL